LAGKIYITGDCHGDHDISKLNSICFPEGKTLDKKDYVIICGDFGLLWNNKPDNKEKYLTTWYNEKKFTTLFVCGNHDNHDRFAKLPIIKKFGGKVGKVSDSIFHLKRGEIYTIYGKKFFTFGGAVSIDKQYRVEGISWWPQEVASVKEMNYGLNTLEKHNNTVDYIIGHTGPKTICDILLAKHSMCKLDDYYAQKGMLKDATEPYFDHIIENVKFEKFYAGHYHVDWQFDKYQYLYNKIVEIMDLPPEFLKEKK